MHLIQLFCLWLFLFLDNFHVIRAFMHHGYEIKDLHETDISLFLKEAESWHFAARFKKMKITEVNLDSNKAPELILGGPDIFNPGSIYFSTNENFVCFQRIYTRLPKHDHVTLLGRFWYFGFGDLLKVKDWGFHILFTNQNTAEQAVRPVLDATFQRGNFTVGEAYFDEIKTGSFHREDTLVLHINVNVKGMKERSFGFRDLTIHFHNLSRNREPFSYICHSSVEPSDFPECQCPFNQGPNDFSVCQDCAENCGSCYGAKPSQCVACGPEGRWNGKECSKCHWNCKTCTGPTEHECLVCNDNYYNYGNGTCLETCNWPFSPLSGWPNITCTKICRPEKFIWGNGLRNDDTCIDECKPPLISYITDQDVRVCENPCSKRGDSRFLYWNRTCLSSCPMPLREVYNGHSRLCENPCGLASQYLYPNRSCLDTCPAPLQSKSDPGVNYCKNPCENPQYYVYNDGSCHSNCRSPLRVKVEYGVRHCVPPCNLVGEYILKNGSCSRECPAPLIQKTELGVGTSCFSPCKSDEELVLSNGSCVLNCPGFFDVRVEHSVKRCLSPCLANQYYFDQNKSCLDTCSYPFLKDKAEEEGGGVNLCKSPCSDSDDFIYDDQSCFESCPDPLISTVEPEAAVKYCKSPCSKEGENKYLKVDGSCQQTCEYPYRIIKQGPYEMCLIDLSTTQANQISSIRKIVKVSNVASEIGGLLGSLIDAGDPTSIFMMPLLQMLEIVKYTDTVLPPHIELLLRGENEVHKSLLQSAFDEKLLRIGIICGMTLMLSGILRVVTPTFNESKAVKVLQKLSLALKWNILAPVLITSMDDIAFYSLRALNHSGIHSYRLLISMFVILPMMIFIIWKIIQVNSEVKRQLNLGQSVAGLERWRFAFEIYKSEGFIVLYIIRVVSVSIIRSCLDEYPLIQAILLVFVSLGMVVHLFCASSFKKKISFIQHTVVEIALLLDNFLLVIMAMMNGNQNIDLDVKNASGQLMTILYLTATILTGIIIVVKLLKNVYIACKTSRSNRGFIQLSELNGEQESNAVLDNEDILQSSMMVMETDEIDNESEDSEEDVSIEASAILV